MAGTATAIQQRRAAAPPAAAGGPPPSAAVTVTASPYAATASLPANFQAVDDDMRARGYEPLGTGRDGRLAAGASIDLPLALEPGHCYALTAVGEVGVRDLDVMLLDRRERTVEADIAITAHPVVRICPDRGGDHTMRVVMRDGAGAFRYAAYHWPRGTQGPFGLSGLLYVRLAEVTSLLGTRGYAPDPDVTPVNGAFRRPGDRREHVVELPPSSCVLLVAVGGEGVHDLDVTVKRGELEVARGESRDAFTAVQTCTDPAAGDPYTVSVEIQEGAGPYFVQVFRTGS
jgi:hypothetical protein